jgi:hypothetical protein
MISHTAQAMHQRPSNYMSEHLLPLYCDLFESSTADRIPTSVPNQLTPPLQLLNLLHEHPFKLLLSKNLGCVQSTRLSYRWICSLIHQSAFPVPQRTILHPSSLKTQERKQTSKKRSKLTPPSNALIISSSFLNTAPARGDWPRSFRVFGSAPCWSRRRTRGRWPW